MNNLYRDDSATIDLMLAHLPKAVSASEGAYNRALHMDRRRELALIWADLIYPRHEKGGGAEAPPPHIPGGIGR